MLSTPKGAFRILEVIGETDCSIRYRAIPASAGAIDGALPRQPRGGKATDTIQGAVVIDELYIKDSQRADDGIFLPETDHWLNHFDHSTGPFPPAEVFDFTKMVDEAVAAGEDVITVNANGTRYLIRKPQEKPSPIAKIIGAVKTLAIKVWKPLAIAAVAGLLIYGCIEAIHSCHREKPDTGIATGDSLVTSVDSVAAAPQEVADEPQPVAPEENADQKKQEADKKAEEAKKAEEKRKQEEAKKAEEKRKQEEAKKAEEKRKQEEARKAEEKRKQEEARKQNEAAQSSSNASSSNAEALKEALSSKDRFNSAATITRLATINHYTPAYYHYARNCISSGNITEAKRYLNMSISAGQNVKACKGLLESLEN